VDPPSSTTTTPWAVDHGSSVCWFVPWCCGWLPSIILHPHHLSVLQYPSIPPSPCCSHTLGLPHEQLLAAEVEGAAAVVVVAMAMVLLLVVFLPTVLVHWGMAPILLALLVIIVVVLPIVVIVFVSYLHWYQVMVAGAGFVVDLGVGSMPGNGWQVAPQVS
jgi:hypothetical protein